MRLLMIMSLLTVGPLLAAGEFNPDLNIGDAAPSWQDLPGTDGGQHSSSDLKDAKAIVVVFTCNSCPYAVDAEERLNALHKTCSQNQTALVAINVNKIPEDLLPAMKARAKEKKLTYPYLFDQTQAIAKQFGARYTPECFVLDADRKIAYMGSLDDSPDGKHVKNKYVENALRAVLAGKKTSPSETVPIGCRIRFDRVKRSRRQRSEATTQ